MTKNKRRENKTKEQQTKFLTMPVMAECHEMIKKRIRENHITKK